MIKSIVFEFNDQCDLPTMKRRARMFFRQLFTGEHQKHQQQTNDVVNKSQPQGNTLRVPFSEAGTFPRVEYEPSEENPSIITAAESYNNDVATQIIGLQRQDKEAIVKFG